MRLLAALAWKWKHRVYNSGAFGFSTLADGVDTRLDIDEDDGSNGDDSDDDDAPVR